MTATSRRNVPTHHTLWTQVFNGGPRGLAPLQATPRFLCQFADGGDEGLFIAIGDRCAMRAIDQVFAGGAVAVGHGRDAAGHGFQGDVAEGFGQAGKHKQVTRGEVFGQRVRSVRPARRRVVRHRTRSPGWPPLKPRALVHRRPR